MFTLSLTLKTEIWLRMVSNWYLWHSTLDGHKEASLTEMAQICNIVETKGPFSIRLQIQEETFPFQILIRNVSLKNRIIGKRNKSGA